MNASGLFYLRYLSIGEKLHLPICTSFTIANASRIGLKFYASMDWKNNCSSDFKYKMRRNITNRMSDTRITFKEI
jgi:hypothetical protein